MAQTYLTRTNSGTGSETKGTFSAWIKRGVLGGSSDYIWHTSEDTNNDIKILTNSSDSIRIRGINNGTAVVNLIPNNLFRDVSAWYHLVVAFDTTQATEADRVKLYINGVQETSFSTATYPSQNLNLKLNQSGDRRTVGNAYDNGGSPSNGYFSGLMSHIHWVDGTAYPASTFGETDATTGEWKIKTSPSVTYGTNGFFILKDGNSVTDQSGQSNNFTVGGGTLTKTEDCPSNVFATLNALVNTSGDTSSLSNGNNTYTNQNYSYNTRSTLGMTSGKFYWEMKVNNASAVKVGVCTSQYDPSLDTDSSTAHYGGAGGGGVYVLMSNSTTTWQSTFSDTSKATGSYTNAIASTSSSILMGAVDVDANKLWVGVDGVWMYSGNPATGANAQITFTNSSPDALHIMASHGDNSTQRSTKFNFGNGYFGTTAVSSAGINASGNGIFEYDVPTGYTALSTKGLNL